MNGPTQQVFPERALPQSMEVKRTVTSLDESQKDNIAQESYFAVSCRHGRSLVPDVLSWSEFQKHDKPPVFHQVQY